MAYAYIAGATPAGGVNGATTSAIDTTGANLIVLVVSYYGTAPTVSDSKGNTWTARTAYTRSVATVREYYCQGGTVGSGHTFTVSGASSFSSVGALSFSGADAAPYDTENGGGNSGSATTQPGSITPSVNDCLIVSATGWNSDGSISINASFTGLLQLAPGNAQNFGTGIAYLIQTTAAAVNPTITNTASSSQYVATTQAAFKAAAGGGTPTLTVPDTSHAHTLDNVVLTSSTALVVQDMAHGHALDAPTLSTGTALTVADAQHAHALDNVTLSTTGATSLTVADLAHGHALDAVVLTSQTDLAAADMAHGHALDGVTLTLGGISLVIAEIMHAHALDAVALTLDTYLAIADLLHAHTIDNVLVSIPGGTLDLILKILVNRQELNPATGTFTLYDNDGTTVLYTTSAWANAAGTVPYSGGALRRIDALF